MEKSGAISPTLSGTGSDSDYHFPTQHSRKHSEQGSIHGLLQDRTFSPSASTVFRDEVDDIGLDVSEMEEEDLNIIAELTRSGRPNLTAILDEEIERASGKLMVACCGPLALNVKIRKLVSQRISPSKILHGEQRGNISLCVEDFD